MRASRSRIGSRNEISILVVSALILLVGLSAFTLFKYRSAVALELEERQRAAERWAAFLRPSLVKGMLPRAEQLRRQLPDEAWITVFDPQGRPLSSTSPTTLETPPRLAGTVSGSAFVERGGERYRVRVDLPARTLRSRERSLEVLTPVVLGVDLAVLILLMVYVQRILAPIGRFVDKAREIQGDTEGE
ncbi:MAG: hypothetical protein MI919_19440 [Holophagales bacterium]|nr:hypothetical protein [Holophagales bacterium]